MALLQTASLSLTHLAQAPRQPHSDNSKPPLLVMLHGVGSHEHDLIGLAPYLDGRFFVVSARAPLNHGTGGFGWYPVQFTPQGITADETVAKQSRDRILAFLGEASGAYGTDPARTYLLGFSQGAIMSIYTALTHPGAVAGIAPMSGRLVPAALAERADDDALRGLPVFAVHGLYDQVLPIGQGREIRDALSRLPLDFTYKEYPMGHEVSPESLSDVSTWLTAQLDKTNNGRKINVPD